MRRRTFLGGMAAWPLAGAAAAAAEGGKPLIVLRSGWQPINIGDVAHTPGVLRLIERHIPGAETVFWPVGITPEIETMLRRAFPAVRIVHSGLDGSGAPTGEAMREVWNRADLFLHGSGPGVFLRDTMRQWREDRGKPYGIYGVTIHDIGEDLRDLLEGAAFVFCRETHSVNHVRDADIRGPAVDFAPDATVALEMLDDEKGFAFLERNGLEPGRYICVVPRLRYTPYHKIRKVNWSEETIREREAVNARHAEADHAKLRHVIAEWVRRTGMKALVCPEMTYQLDIIHPLVIDPLPDDVKPNVAARDAFWLPDEAGSVYKRARAVISMECHSPLIAYAHGTSAFYVRQPEDTIKGQMYYDFGLDDWVFEIGETEGADIAARLMGVHENRGGALDALGRAKARMAERHRATMGIVREVLGLG